MKDKLSEWGREIYLLLSMKDNLSEWDGGIYLLLSLIANFTGNFQIYLNV